MSNYEYMTGMGTNGDGIILGPGVSVTPDAPPPYSAGNDLNDFINKLKTEQGPFVYIGKDSTEGKKFVAWLTMYDPSFPEWFMKLALVKMSAAALAVSDGVSAIPEWVSGNTIQFRKSLYDLYLVASSRINRILVTQGKILSTSIPPIELQSFMVWWKNFDLPGVAALTAMYVVEEDPLKPPVIEVPKQLFEFWKTTKGQVEPPKPLLGLGTSWFDWALDNWLWLLGGAAGGVVVARWYMRQEKSRDISENPRAREGWGSEVKTKAGVFMLHPLIPETHYKQLRSMNMKLANKFRVSEGGQSLGELHKSHGKRKWKAISYYGVEKFGNSRAALLRWLKDGASAQATEAQLDELGILLPPTSVAPNMTRGVL